jgi:hypothetical protein
MRDLLKHFRRRGQCQVVLSQEGVSVRRIGTSRTTAAVIERRLGVLAETPDSETLAAQIATALDRAGGNGLPVYVTLGDELVRYFIVTPPANAARLEDLHAAAAVRFQTLYGDTAEAWQVTADWQAGEPFLACAVRRNVLTALRQGIAQGGGCLVAVTPCFVDAWNVFRGELDANAWLATLREGALTLGLVAKVPKPRLVSVRTLVLPEPALTLTWLRERVARAALLEDVTAPDVLHIHGRKIDGWHMDATSTGDAGMNVHWHESDALRHTRKGRGAWISSRLWRVARNGATS